MATTRSPDSRTPLIVERYAIHDEFAAGGMATVHFARVLGAQGFRRTVAAKRLLPHLTRDSDFALMLVDEARLAARVRHPNVVSTLDVVQTESELVLVMEYVHGESLAKLSRAASERGTTIPLPIATAIVIDALHGLHAAHEAKDERGQPLALVHRDVSPQNLLVGTDGITRIADFGIAKASGRIQSTPDGAVKGKLWYMAPEQLEGSVVTRTTDVFATSVVLWELLTGERLFEGVSQSESICKVLVAPIPAPSTRNPALSPELDAIVARGLARDPQARFASARAMALALEGCAPAIRPSEIAAWVEHAAGPALARRAQMMAAIEHEADPSEREDDDGDAETALLFRPEPDSAPRGSAQLDTPVLTPPSAQRWRADATPTPSGAPRTRRQRRWPLLIAALLTIATVAGGASIARLARSPLRDAPAPLPVAGQAQALSRTEDAGSPQPERALAAPSSVLAPVSPASAPPPGAAAPTSAPDPTRAGEGARVAPVPARLDKAPSRLDRRPSRAIKADCDPPYSIDTKGKILFKLECM